MSIRTEHNQQNPYAMINKKALEDKRLSFESAGILAYLCSLPNGAEITVESLASSHKCDPENVRKSISDLVSAGYLQWQTDTEGKFLAIVEPGGKK
jgi:hypothetical protein